MSNYMNDKERLEALRILTDTYVRMNSMYSCETGQKSHALWHSTDFIKREIKDLLRYVKGGE